MNSNLIDQHLVDLLHIPAEQVLKDLHPAKTSKVAA
jgi:hypothetical protein